MKIATWNVNGIRAREAQLLEWIAREQPDIVCLQEIKAAIDQVPASIAATTLLELSAVQVRSNGSARGGFGGSDIDVFARF